MSYMPKKYMLMKNYKPTDQLGPNISVSVPKVITIYPAIYEVEAVAMSYWVDYIYHVLVNTKLCIH